jgi:F-type H+-transporting ATPase subunit epsilon
LRLEIISPDEEIFTGEVSSIVVPAIDGSLGILDNHAPLITTLKEGDIELKGDSDQVISIKGGVLEVLRNKVVILAE